MPGCVPRPDPSLWWTTVLATEHLRPPALRGQRGGGAHPGQFVICAGGLCGCRAEASCGASCPLPQRRGGGCARRSCPEPLGGGLFMEVAGRSHRAGHLLKLPPLPTALRRCSSVPRRRQSGWPSMPRDCVPVPAATRSSATCDKASGQVHTRLPGVLLFSRTLIFTSDTRV